MKIVTGAAIVGLLGLLAPESRAQAPASTTPEAKARLDSLISAYRALPNYADRGETTLVVSVGGKATRRVHRASVAYSRPNKLDVQSDLVRVVADGSSLTTAVAPLRTYQTTPAPRKLAESILRGGPLGAEEFGGVAGRPLAHVLNLVLGDEPERLILDFAPRLVVEPDRQVDGTSYRVLRLDEADNDDWRFLIDPQSGLLAFIELVIEGDAAKGSIAGPTTRVESLRWAAGTIETKPPAEGSFTFKAPEGYKPVAKLGAPPAEKLDPAKVDAVSPKAGHPLIGNPAPDFTVDVLDGPGKARKLSRSDLLGKVVLVEFWATWSNPCFKDLPDIAKLAGSYSRDGKDVVVIALCIDRAESGDPVELRSAVEATLKLRKLDLGGLVAIDPTGKLAEAYRVEAVPTAVLVDPKGIVRNVHVGLIDVDALGLEIEGLLKGRNPGQ